MTFTRNFTELKKEDVAIAGGKGASLGEMTQVGIPVPPGFVVTAQAFDEFLKVTDLNVELDAILDKVDHTVMDWIEPEQGKPTVYGVNQASKIINALITRVEIPADIANEILEQYKILGEEFVAVRSSATSEDSKDAAWAGQLDSYLNITKKKLLESAQRCWASLFTPRAIFYRFEKGLHGNPISVAVVVQKMIESEVSGIAFSVHPVTQDHDQLIIEAGFGLGEAIVQGAITPDSYVVEKSNWKILDKNITAQQKGIFRGKHGGSEWKDVPKSKGEQPTLSDDEVINLAKLVVKIERHYGFPVDVEWARENNQFYIVQSRPITTLQAQINTSQMKSTRPNPKDYVRMFANKSFVYLLSDIFLQYYNALEVLSIQDEESWISFLPRSSQEETQVEGKKLYTSKRLYKKYNQEFHDFIRSSGEYFESMLAQDEINAAEVKKFFELASRHFSFYSKTEFFYTDLLDQENMALTVQEFDKLKLDGRAYLNKIIFENKGYVRTLLRKIASQTKVSESDLLSYSIEEIVELVKSHKQVDKDVLKDRFVFFASKDLTLFGEESRSLVNEFLSVYRRAADTIRGTVANKGKVRGKARVFNPDFKDFDKIAHAVEKMQQGEILVAETTAPEIIQACKKAAAIITNQGGMLSHAAIVSRELGVPCIIGTDKDVLLSIKTGDIVEVDADEGIVRILESK